MERIVVPVLTERLECTIGMSFINRSTPCFPEAVQVRITSHVALVKMADVPKNRNFYCWPVTIEKMGIVFPDWLIAQQTVHPESE